MLEFQNGDMPRLPGNDIRKHLASCEFCFAEIEFYSRYPQEDGNGEMVETAEIPAPLYELAEALLKNRHGDSSSLDSLLKEKGGFVINKR